MSRELGRRGHTVDVYTRRENSARAQIVEMGENARVIHIGAGPEGPADKNQLFQYLPEFAQGVRRFARSNGLRYDLIHSHYWLSGWVARELREAWGAPVIQMFHTLGRMKQLVASDGEPPEHERRIAVEGEIMRWADRVIAATERDQQQMTTLYGADSLNMRVIPCGVDLSLFHPYDPAFARQSIGVGPDMKMVLFVGRMEPLKGIDDLLRAIARIIRDHSLPCKSVGLILIGGSAEDHPDQISAEMQRLLRLRDGLGLNEMVTFLGAQGQELLPLYYSAADVLVMPSHYESFGMVALEAMACATPVVASDVGGLSYTVEDGVTGFLVPERNPAALADRICDILNDQPFRDQLGQQALQAAQRYSWGRVAGQIEEVYREVLTSSLPAMASCRYVPSLATAEMAVCHGGD
ncbi:MAG: glycosyltransferase [Chloroflexi bacterium]|nr:glycosyltransferase [Chloroflexota bacterium]